MNRHTDYCAKATALERNVKEFLGERNITFCYLAKDKVERYRIARDIREWVRIAPRFGWHKDQRLASDSGADTIEIP
jgi:hypothetical protein